MARLVLGFLATLALSTATLAAEEAIITTPAEIAFGKIEFDDGRKTSEVKAQLKPGVRLQSLRTSCGCVKATTAAKLPFTATEESNELTVSISISTDDVLGEVRKHVFLRYLDLDGKAAMTRLPVTAMIIDSSTPAIFDTPGEALPKNTGELTPYDGRSPQQFGNDILLFNAKGCNKCVWMKNDWLPRYKKKHPNVTPYVADLDTKKGLAVYTTFKTATPVVLGAPTPKEELPAVFIDGSMVFGTRALEALVQP